MTYHFFFDGLSPTNAIITVVIICLIFAFIKLIEKNTMNSMPHELVWGEVYFPPLLLVITLAYMLTILVGTVATKLGLHKYVAFPALVELSLIVIFTGVIGQFITIF
jgi:hypothetical protein